MDRADEHTLHSSTADARHGVLAAECSQCSTAGSSPPRKGLIRLAARAWRHHRRLQRHPHQTRRSNQAPSLRARRQQWMHTSLSSALLGVHVPAVYKALHDTFTDDPAGFMALTRDEPPLAMQGLEGAFACPPLHHLRGGPQRDGVATRKSSQHGPSRQPGGRQPAPGASGATDAAGVHHQERCQALRHGTGTERPPLFVAFGFCCYPQGCKH